MTEKKQDAVTFNPVRQPLAYNIGDAALAIGVGRGKIHELVGNGRLASKLVGGRRIISLAELDQRVNEGDCA